MNVSEVSPGQQAGQGQRWPREAGQVTSGGPAYVSEGFIKAELFITGLSGLLALSAL